MREQTRSSRRSLAALVALLLAAGPLPAVAQQDAEVQRLSVPLTDPARPLTLHASLLQGGISVQGYDGNEVRIEVVAEPVSRYEESSGGMRRIPNNSLNLTVEERDNVVAIDAGWASRVANLRIRVPRRASLRLSCTNSGDVVADGVEGEHVLKNTNGSIRAANVRGSVVAETVNGDVTVEFREIDRDAPMSFVTLNGHVDVTLPADLSADLRFHTGHGEILTDFEFEVLPQKPEVETSSRGGGYRVKLEQEVHARIGGGGPEYHFRTFTGDIYVRRAP